MKMLMPIGAVLIAIGMAGSAAACYGNSIFDGAETETAAQLNRTTDSPAEESKDSSPRLFLAPLSGLARGVGLVCVGIGMGNCAARFRRTSVPRTLGAISRMNTVIRLKGSCSSGCLDGAFSRQGS